MAKYPSPCETCGKELLDKQRATQCKARHENSENFKCNLCDKAYLRSADMLRHKRNKHGGPNKGCDHCDKKFKHKPHFKKHIKEKHTKPNGKTIAKPQTLCNVCEEYVYIEVEKGTKIYESQFLLDTWIKNCNKEGKKTSYKGSSNKNVKENILLIHQKIYPCNTCKQLVGLTGDPNEHEQCA